MLRVFLAMYGINQEEIEALQQKTEEFKDQNCTGFLNKWDAWYTAIDKNASLMTESHTQYRYRYVYTYILYTMYNQDYYVGNM
jgi:hypothetical protein